MSQISSSFVLKSKYPNFERDSFKTRQDMEIIPSAWMDEGHISYCLEDGHHYIFSSKNGETGLDRWTLINNNSQNLNDYYTSIEVDNKLGEYYTSIEVDNKLGEYYTSIEVDDKLNNNYYTTSAIDEKFNNYYTSIEVDNKLEEYYTSTQVDGKLEGYVTLDQFNTSTDGYCTTIYIEDKLNNYYTSSQVDSKLEEYCTIESIEDNYYTTGAIDEKLIELDKKYVLKSDFDNNSTIPTEELEEIKSNILDLDDKLSTVTIAAGSIQQSLDDYKIVVENTYTKTEDLEKNFVKGETFQNNIAIIDTRFNELEKSNSDKDIQLTESIDSLKKEVNNLNNNSVFNDQFEEYKEYVDNTYIKPDEVSSKLNNYSPSKENSNRWIGSPYAGNLAGLTGLEVANRAYSYNAVLDQMLFGDFTPTVSTPSVNVALKEDWNNEGEINWYDEKNRIILVESGTIGPDGGDFIATNIKNSIITYPEFIDLDHNFTNGLIPSTDEKQTSIGFCKIKNEQGEWDYYKKDNNIYHVPHILEVGEYRYYMAAYFSKGSPAINNDNLIVGEWDEKTPIESQDYITFIASKPTFYNDVEGFIANPIKVWGDMMVDYMILKPSCVIPQCFKLPRKLKELYIWNDLAGDYAMVPMVYQKVEGVANNNLIPAYFDESLDENGYYTYIYDSDSNGHRGEIKIKVVF